MRTVLILPLWLLCGMFCATGAAAQEDIPAGHWASDALDYLVERDIIAGACGFFRGDRPVTAYEFQHGVLRLVDILAADGRVADPALAKAAVLDALAEAAWRTEGDAVPVSGELPAPLPEIRPGAIDGEVRRGGSGFDDVPDDHWAARAVLYLRDQGYLAGYP